MINKDFFLALDELEMQKKINKEQFIEALETALTSAYKKMYGEAKNALVKLNPEKNTIKIYSYKKVVEEPEDMDKEISLEEARKLAGETLLTIDALADRFCTFNSSREAYKNQKTFELLDEIQYNIIRKALVYELQKER